MAPATSAERMGDSIKVLEALTPGPAAFVPSADALVPAPQNNMGPVPNNPGVGDAFVNKAAAPAAGWEVCRRSNVLMTFRERSLRKDQVGDFSVRCAARARRNTQAAVSGCPAPPMQRSISREWHAAARGRSHASTRSLSSLYRIFHHLSGHRPSSVIDGHSIASSSSCQEHVQSPRNP
jgi:hypothetical protein